MNEFSKIAGYKKCHEKSVMSLYTTNEQSEIKFRKTIPLMIASNSIKYLSMILTNEMKDLYIITSKLHSKKFSKT
jgi:hypothetical protein